MYFENVHKSTAIYIYQIYRISSLNSTPKKVLLFICGIAAKPSSVKQKMYNLALSSGERILIIQCSYTLHF